MQRLNRSHHWGVILAGGEGQCPRPLARWASDDDRPKQFSAILPGGRTTLQQTQARITRWIEPSRTVTVLNRRHQPFYADQFLNVPPERLAVQPEYRGTFAAIVFGLAKVVRQDPDAIVGFFPADHHYLKENRFSAGLGAAFSAAECSSAKRVILLGVKARYPETAYGYIEPQVNFRDSDNRVRGVARFWEKPGESIARDLVDRGCLWNTFVMVGRAAAFIDLIRSAAPGLYHGFDPLFSKAPLAELATVASIYRRIPTADFSRSVLSAAANRLAVVPLGDIGWTDLGEPRRLLETLFLYPERRAWEGSFAAAS